MNQPKTIKIDEVEYVRADAVSEPATEVDGKRFVIIRSYGAGVFAGYLAERDDDTRVVMLDQCIRMHRWTGCSLTQVAQDGIAGTGENHFTRPLDGHEILQVIEILPASEKARLAIQGVTPWVK